MNEHKSPNAELLYRQWLQTDEGKKCWQTPADGEYLRNRLWWAYMAGFQANRGTKA